jgi:Putative MetA-pathway of phenol degradation
MTNNYISVLLLFISLTCSGQGSDWFLKPGMLHLDGRFEYIKTNEYFDNDGEAQDIFDYTSGTTFIHAQYGLSSNVNIGFVFPAIVYNSADFDFASAGNQTISNTGIGDATLFLKYKVYSTEKSLALLKGSVVLPSGDESNRYNLNTGYRTFSQSIGAEYIYTHSNNFYMQAYGGFLNRGNDFSDEVVAGGNIAYQPLSHFWTILVCRAINPLENGDDKKSGGIPGLSSNNSGFLRLGMKIDFTPSDLLKIYGAALYPLKGQFVQNAIVFEAGVGVYLISKK